MLILLDLLLTEISETWGPSESSLKKSFLNSKSSFCLSNAAENYLRDGLEISDIIGAPFGTPFLLIPSPGSFQLSFMEASKDSSNFGILRKITNCAESMDWHLKLKS